MISLVRSLAVVGCLTASVSAQTLPVEVQRVYDGDTITAATVRPAGDRHRDRDPASGD